MRIDEMSKEKLLETIESMHDWSNEEFASFYQENEGFIVPAMLAQTEMQIAETKEKGKWEEGRWKNYLSKTLEEAKHHQSHDDYYVGDLEKKTLQDYSIGDKCQYQLVDDDEMHEVAYSLEETYELQALKIDNAENEYRSEYYVIPAFLKREKENNELSLIPLSFNGVVHEIEQKKFEVEYSDPDPDNQPFRWSNDYDEENPRIEISFLREDIEQMFDEHIDILLKEFDFQKAEQNLTKDDLEGADN